MPTTLHTKVAIIGAGPVGSYLANRLSDRGVDFVVLERLTHADASARGRAGLLEHRVAALLRRHGLAEGLDRAGEPHRGATFHAGGEVIHLDLAGMVGERGRTVYPQHRLVADMHERLHARGERLLFETEAVAVEVSELAGAPARLRCRTGGGEPIEIEAELVVACDGPRGLGRRAVEAAHPGHTFAFPYVWLAVLARCPPSAPHAVYGVHGDGFAGHMLRSLEHTRFYLQIPQDEVVGTRSDAAIWAALEARLEAPGFVLRRGPIEERAVLALRTYLASSFVHGRLLLAGDAAHSVPPCGGKGMNLGVLDGELLATLVPEILDELHTGGAREAQRLVASYDRERRAEVLGVVHFVHEMTLLLHRSPETAPGNAAFEAELNLAYLRRLRDDPGYGEPFARAYIGLG